MEFTEQTLRQRLFRKPIGGSVYFFPEIGSTNDHAISLAAAGAAEGTLVVADLQTRGKGRLKRVWQSPPRANFYGTFILRPAVTPAQAPQITLLAGVAVAETLAPYCPGQVTLKWPNDVRIRGRKVCGILTEMKTTGGVVDFVVVGIGININIRKDELDEAFRDISTSLREETGMEISRLDVAAALCDHLHTLYTQYGKNGFAEVRDRWIAYADLLGKTIQVVFQNEVTSGTVTGIDEYGALMLIDEQGETKRILAGDASVVKNRS
jgi:BirA family transcriptional regulator, biotin operon repressor / biotin---[acetyl-CoA-carboxylase] ligase